MTEKQYELLNNAIADINEVMNLVDTQEDTDEVTRRLEAFEAGVRSGKKEVELLLEKRTAERDWLVHRLAKQILIDCKKLGSDASDFGVAKYWLEQASRRAMKDVRTRHSSNLEEDRGVVRAER